VARKKQPPRAPARRPSPCHEDVAAPCARRPSPWRYNSSSPRPVSSASPSIELLFHVLLEKLLYQVEVISTKQISFKSCHIMNFASQGCSCVFFVSILGLAFLRVLLMQFSRTCLVMFSHFPIFHI
jgi:hypothetical protein